jgi:hypothetical protein
MLLICPNLESLDISFTLVKSPQKNIDFEAHPSRLQKLNLTSTSVSGADLAATLPHLPLLRTLSIGALGSRQGSTLSISNSSAMTLTEDDLVTITQTLSTFKHLENISLVGNTKLCLVSKHAVSDFVCLVGRRCKVCFSQMRVVRMAYEGAETELGRNPGFSLERPSRAVTA